MRTIALFTSLLLFAHSITQAQAFSLSSLLEPAGMKGDFRYLRTRVEQTYPALYVHQSRERMQWIFDSLENTLQQPLPFGEFYKKIAFLIAELRCEHTYCSTGAGYNQLVKQFAFLPLQLFLAGDKPFVMVNFSADTTIFPGDEIISINGRSVDSICRELYRYMPSDGFMEVSKTYALSSMAFGIAYNMFIEQPRSYTVVVKNKKGKLLQRQFTDHLSIDEFSNIALKNPANKVIWDAEKRAKALNSKDWRLEILQPKTALLVIRTFSADKHDFKRAMDGYFKTIRENQIEHLIIDLGWNGGGEEELSAYAMSYLIDTPTRFMDAEYLITDADSVLASSNVPDEIRKNKYAYIEPLKNGRSYARISEYARELEVMQPKPNGYHGKVYVLVNGVTSSAASTFAAVAQSNNRAVIIGQETAGSFLGGGTVLGLDLTLPYSKIATHTSIVYQEFSTHGRDGNRGVVPDKVYKPTFEDMTGSYENWKKKLLQMVL
ncbi:Peptidase family S41 [Filimonas lacunae]|uniref:Peptidase family S41 n=1 Tax=Filimonas lacunae TaxID=477680 RepID=A0A173MLI7_9BACT|nr:S41 family peptidase [Filimonas lacunae]BAV08340.1 peptidase, S41 family [Filimonas lacunae]SIT33417.1 Peptidase family S41 [Filimonas lacunae]